MGKPLPETDGSHGFPFLRPTRFWAQAVGHSFAADDAEPSHHFAQESPQPCNLINLVANAYNTNALSKE
ncbi:MAG TPA: hypothetical protein VK463_02570 [Desulfomonilaceae bacterium]|nr:hypothetical protein [Desulfomonilaceae bacterium]